MVGVMFAVHGGHFRGRLEDRFKPVFEGLEEAVLAQHLRHADPADKSAAGGEDRQRQ